MVVRMRPRWLPLVVSLSVLVAAVPAVGDRLTTHLRDEDALLVGEPTETADVRQDQATGATGVDAGTFKTYTFPVQSPLNRLEIDLRYDPGLVSPQGPCIRANDLDLFVEGPGDYQMSFPGCDNGGITILETDVPAGEYTVTVDADHGSTVCVPDDVSQPCTAPGIEYLFEVKVFDRTV